MKLWTLEYFGERFGTVKVKVRNSEGTREMMLGEYIDYMKTDSILDDPLYLSNWIFESDVPELVSDYKVLSVFRNWLEAFPEKLRPRWRWLYIGPCGSGSTLHRDTMNSSAWLGLTCGRKEWIFIRPDEQCNLYDRKVDPFNPDFDRFPDFARINAIRYTQRPGVIVYTPSGWIHAVRNMEPTIAITENFVNDCNYPAFEAYVTEKHLVKDWSAASLNYS